MQKNSIINWFVQLNYPTFATYKVMSQYCGN
jgi:hypothetical protein